MLRVLAAELGGERARRDRRRPTRSPSTSPAAAARRAARSSSSATCRTRSRARSCSRWSRRARAARSRARSSWSSARWPSGSSRRRAAARTGGSPSRSRSTPRRASCFTCGPGSFHPRPGGDVVDHPPDAARGAARARARRRAVRGGREAGVLDAAQDVARRAGRAAFGETAVTRARSPRAGIAGTRRAEQLSVADFARARGRACRTRRRAVGDSGAMPELPEVETIVRGLAPRLRGRRVESVWWSGQPLHLRRKVDLARPARGRRRAARSPACAASASTSWSPSTDAADGGVVIHLGMTGRLRVEPASAPRAPHTHVVFRLAGGDELRFVDARRFGWVEPARGPSRRRPRSRARARSADRARRAGAGGGARGRARAHQGVPARPAAGRGPRQHLRLRGAATARASTRRRRPAACGAARPTLLAAIRATLEGGIARRGTTLRDYVDADGRGGDNAPALLVYGREGEPCRRCGARIKRRVDAGRSTFFCPGCQRR